MKWLRVDKNTPRNASLITARWGPSPPNNFAVAYFNGVYWIHEPGGAYLPEKLGYTPEFYSEILPLEVSES